jgi:adenylosuccinate lyase
MQANLDKLHGLVFSQRVLLTLTQVGMSREDAYQTVQRHAMDAWKGQGDFLTLLKSDPEVSQHLDDATLSDLFDMSYHTKHVDTVFARLFGEA